MIRDELAQEGLRVSIRRLCGWLACPRSAVYRPRRSRQTYRMSGALATEIRHIINQHPAYGVRRITWALNQGRAVRVNWKAVHRIVCLKGWSMHKRPKGLRPRARGWRSQVEQPNQQWAIDTSHFFTQRDGWCHVTAVIDCCDRMLIGWRVSQSGKADIAGAALEDALIRRQPSAGLTLRSDNGLVFGAEAFQKVVRSAGLRQQYITPYTPEQNGMIERWFRTLKEECLWRYNFETLDEAREIIDRFILTYNTDRPHQALRMLSPSQWRERYAA
jgi:putative transposase